jgi:hypothetical protein
MDSSGVDSVLHDKIEGSWDAALPPIILTSM